MLTHDELFTVGWVNFGEPRRMTAEEMEKEFPCHFFVLKDADWVNQSNIRSGVVVRVSFGNRLLCKRFIMQHMNQGYSFWFTGANIRGRDITPDMIANNILKDFGSDMGGYNCV